MLSTNGHGPKRAVLYTRASTDEQARSGYSLAQQHRSRPVSSNSRRLAASAGQKGEHRNDGSRCEG